MVVTSSCEFRQIARGMGVKNLRCFNSNFIFTPSVVAAAWNKMTRKRLLPRGGKPWHFLWFLHWVKAYLTYDQGAARFHCNRDTFSTWILAMALAFSKLNNVSLVVVFVMVLSIHSSMVLWLLTLAPIAFRYIGETGCHQCHGGNLCIACSQVWMVWHLHSESNALRMAVLTRDFTVSNSMALGSTMRL